jgi:hypothetical protein
VLRLNFHAGPGDPPTLMLATFVRFCADGRLRGPDNYVVAQCEQGLWQVSGRPHRELDCEGPVRVRIVSRDGESAIQHGPFKQLHTVGGVLHADDCCMHVCMPGRVSDFAAKCHEISFIP